MVQMSEALPRFLNDEFIFWLDIGIRRSKVGAQLDRIGQSIQRPQRT
ncbi:hypothetical protein [Azospirillum largimobile]